MRALAAGFGLLFLLAAAAAPSGGGQLGRSQESTSRSARREKLPKAKKVNLHLDLAGEVYYLEETTQKLPDFSRLKPVSKLRTKRLNVEARDSGLGFPGVLHRTEYIGIDFRGTATIKKQGLYAFLLTSDDGAQLYLDDQLLIDNDGIHGPRQEEAEIVLSPGVYRVRVPYFQGPGNKIALVLEAYWLGE